MKQQFVSSAEAAAHGARLSQAEVVSYSRSFYVQDVISSLKKMHNASFVENDSFLSAASAASGAEIGGKRAFLVSSMPNSRDMAFASYLRLPVVAAVFSKVSELTMKHDHSAAAALAGSGCLVFMPENNIEIAESIVQAYKVCEDPKVLLPAAVNIDVPYSDSVQLPNEIFVKRFLGQLKLAHKFDGKLQYGMMDDNYADFAKQQHRALKNAVEKLEASSLSWKKKFRTTMPLVEAYKTDDADLIVVTAGFYSTTAKAAVNKLRASGKKVGLLRLRVLRPWPADAIKAALKSAKKVAVFDQAADLGIGGVVYKDVKPFAAFCSDFISLGRYMGENDFVQIFDRLEKSDKEEIVWL